jgi:hypothetical protein
LPTLCPPLPLQFCRPVLWPGCDLSRLSARWISNGWGLGGIYTVSDGVAFTQIFGTDGDPLGLNSNDPWDSPNRLTGPGCKSLINPGNVNNYIKTECCTVPTAPPSFFTGPNPLCSSDPHLGADAIGDPTLFQCFNLRRSAGRNILTGSGLSNLDFSRFKNNKVSENVNLQFRTELLNVLNRPSFAVQITPDNTDIYYDSVGTPTGVAGLLKSTVTTAQEIQFALKFV